MTKNKGWCYFVGDNHFGDIWYTETYPERSSSEGNSFGPFETWSEAKAHALEYFKADLRETKATIQEIKSLKKKKRL